MTRKTLSDWINYYDSMDKFDKLCPVRTITGSFVPDKGQDVGIMINGEIHQFKNDWARDQFLTKIGFYPPAFIDSLRGVDAFERAESKNKKLVEIDEKPFEAVSPEVVDRFLRMHQARNPDQKFFLRYMRMSPIENYRIRATLSEKYVKIDHTKVLGMVNRAIDENHTVVSRFDDPDRTYFNVAFDEKVIEPISGDPVLLGMQVSNSEVGSGSVMLNGFTYRMICTNGAVVPLQKLFGFRQRHYGKNAAEIQDKVRIAVKRLINEMDRYGKRLELSAQIKLEDPARELEIIGQRFRVSDKLMLLVEEAFQQEHWLEGTLYHISQAFTRTAQHKDVWRSSNRNQLMEVGGTIIMEDPVTAVVS